tara:strand:+ start:251 stop:658 length:408 start_codon:yes stop_codon:yes gene_type:complete
VEKAVGLVDTLTSYGPFTVFAPNYAAFSKLPTGAVETLLKPENTVQLVSSLTCHVVPCAVKRGDIAGKKMDVKTVQGAVMNVNTKSGAMIANSNAETADFEACNGAIHTMDKVIQPPGLCVLELISYLITKIRGR